MYITGKPLYIVRVYLKINTYFNFSQNCSELRHKTFRYGNCSQSNEFLNSNNGDFRSTLYLYGLKKHYSFKLKYRNYHILTYDLIYSGIKVIIGK